MCLQRKSYWAQTLLSYAWLRKFFLNWLIKRCHWLRCTFSNILNQESPGLDVFICCQPPSTFLCLYPPLEPSFIQSWSGIWEWHLQTIEGSDYLWNVSLSHRQFPKWSWKRKRAFENSRAPVVATPCISWSLFLQHKFRWTHHAWLHMKKNQLPTLTTLSLHTGRLWNGRLVHKPPQPQLAEQLVKSILFTTTQIPSHTESSISTLYHSSENRTSEVLTMQRYFAVSDWDPFLVSTTIAYEIERHAYMGTWFKNRLPAEAVFGTCLLLCGPSCWLAHALQTLVFLPTFHLFHHIYIWENFELSPAHCQPRWQTVQRDIRNHAHSWFYFNLLRGYYAGYGNKREVASAAVWQLQKCNEEGQNHGQQSAVVVAWK